MGNINLSVIVPIYNGADYVKKCYEQLINQTLEGLEIIFIDDGSNDLTANICSKLGYENDNFHFYRQDNQGVSAARNLGISKAQGEFLGFVDVDDEYEKDMYEVLYNIAKKNSLDIVSMDSFGEDGQITLINDKNEMLKLFLENKMNISSCFKIFKRSLCPNFQFPDGIQIYEDYMAVFKAICACKRLGIVNACKYHYIKHEDSNSRSIVFQKKYFDAIDMVRLSCAETNKKYPDLEDACNRRMAITYLRISKIYYMRKHPKQFKNQIRVLKNWLYSIRISDALHYYSKFDFIRYILYLYAFPIFIVLIKTIDRE